jgi:hypothetical protein
VIEPVLPFLDEPEDDFAAERLAMVDRNVEAIIGDPTSPPL